MARWSKPSWTPVAPKRSCVMEEDYLGWSIPYNTASERKTHFSAASITLEIERKTATITVVVSKHITEDMLMGRDIPHFRHYLKKALDVEPRNDELDTPPTTVTIESGMVVTRAQQLQQDNFEEEKRLQQERDGPIGSALYPVAEGSEVEELESDEANKKIHPTDERDGEAESDEVLDGVITREELSESQRNDDTLKHIRDKAGINKEPYFWHKGVLMRRPYNTLEKDLIMVPKVTRSRILRLAHNSPIAGYYASERTLSTIRTRMDWPGVAKDVKDLCASCPICQKAGPAIIVKASLNPPPIIKEVFTRIAMDVFGPLNRTKAGNKYILFLMDYATKWPEAFALRNVTAETIVNCLIEVTARIGVPQELLTGNGSNFMSKVMKKCCSMTGIKQIRTSPYHPQTYGMVERFNATLKRLLRKLTQNSGVEWDLCLPYVLWFYRGTTHKTTGFSLYQLLFGKQMRMPLDQMVRYWQGKEENDESSVSEYIATLKANMQIVRDLAHDKERDEKVKQKFYHDQKAKERTFTVGDFVLVFRP